MAEPQHYPPVAMSSRKREREVEEDGTPKRLRNSSYSAEKINSGNQPSHDVSRPAQAHQNQEHLQVIRVQQVQWLQNAKAHLQQPPLVSFPNSFRVPAIPMDSDWAKVRMPILRPGNIFGLRSLTPAQRFHHYNILCAYGRTMYKHLTGGEDMTSQWKLICGMSNYLAKKEQAWYMSFSHDKTGESRLKQIKAEQTIPVKLISTDIQEIASDSFSIPSVNCTAGSRTDSSVEPAIQEVVLVLPTSHPIQLIAGGRTASPVVLDNETPSHESNCSPGTSLVGAPPGDNKIQTPSTGVKRSLELPEETEGQQSARKKVRTEQTNEADKARAERIDNDLNQFKLNETAINELWELRQGDRRAPWFVKWMTCKTDLEGAQSRKSQPLAKTKSNGRSNSVQVDTKVQLYKKPAETSDGTSPAEIHLWRTQYEGARPDERKHPLDIVPVPDYPREDTVEKSVLRADGMYECQHLREGNHFSFACCKNGLNASAKEKSCKKAVKAFQIKVEDLVIKGDLHIAHKDWDLWYNKKLTNQKEKDRIGALLQAVERSGRWSKQRQRRAPQPQQAMIAHPKEPPQIPSVQPANKDRTDPDTQLSSSHHCSSVQQAPDSPVPSLQTLSGENRESCRLQLPLQAIRQESKSNPVQNQTVASEPSQQQVAATTLTTKVAASNSTVQDLKETTNHSNVVEGAQSTTNNALSDEELIMQLIEDDTPWAGDTKAQSAQITTVAEASPALSDADLDSLFGDDPGFVVGEDEELNEDLTASKMAIAPLKALSPQSKPGLAFDSSQEPTAVIVEDRCTQDMSAVSQVSAAEELYNSLLIDGEPCREFVDTFSDEHVARF